MYKYFNLCVTVSTWLAFRDCELIGIIPFSGKILKSLVPRLVKEWFSIWDFGLHIFSKFFSDRLVLLIELSKVKSEIIF